jgi:pilus assembly protein CpaC
VLVLILVATSAHAQSDFPRANPMLRHEPNFVQQVRFRSIEDPSDDRESLLHSISTTEDSIQIVMGQGRLLSLRQDLIAPGHPSAFVAVGDPSVADFEIVGARQIRVTGRRLGVTDLSIITPAGTNHTFEVHVVADLDVLALRIQQAFPNARVKLSPLRQHVVVEGQARDARQIAQIVALIEAHLSAVQPQRFGTTDRAPAGTGAADGGRGPGGSVAPLPDEPSGAPAAEVSPDTGRPTIRVTSAAPEVINLMQVPGPQQVLLKVQIAELNRTALRELGVDFLYQDRSLAIGQNVGGGFTPARIGDSGLIGLVDPLVGGATAFGVFDGGKLSFFLAALRRNQVFSVLAEPNLVALHGQEASFLAGGEFPIPVPQGGAAVGAITIQYKEFGVGLSFIPHILDGETVRLAVSPEVSSVDFALGIVQQGIQIPALSTRKTSTVVELRQGQTLAISGLLTAELDGTVDRIPGLGDLPHIGPFFRNTSMRRVEKELVVLVTPYLVEPLRPEQVGPLPGDEIVEPTDHELFKLGLIEGKTGVPFRSTTETPYVPDFRHLRIIEQRYLFGPCGYSQ